MSAQKARTVKTKGLSHAKFVHQDTLIQELPLVIVPHAYLVPLHIVTEPQNVSFVSEENFLIPKC